MKNEHSPSGNRNAAQKHRAAIYARCAMNQTSIYDPLKREIDCCQEYILRHPGWQSISVYSDRGASGLSSDRPEYQQMLVDCRAGKIGMIVVQSISDFSRSPSELFSTLAELRSLGVEVVFLEEGLKSFPDTL